MKAWVHVAVALALCARAWADPTRLALGDAGTDTYNHVWGYDHVARALAGGRSPLHSDAIVYPTGATLWFIDMAGAVLLAPVTLLGGSTLAYNLYVCGCLAFAGIAAAWLARAAGADPPGAMLAGLLFQTSPHLLGEAFNGISETLAVGWIALAGTAALGLRREPTWRRAVLLSLALAAAGLSNWYYGLFAGGLALALGRVRAPWLGAFALAALLLSLPAWLFRSTLDAADAAVTRDAEFVWRTLVGHNMTDVVAMVVPVLSPDLEARFDERLRVVVYLGGATLLAAGFGRRHPRARGWLVGAGVAGVLALGPFLFLGGRYVGGGSWWVPLPFLALWEFVPSLGRVAHAYRFVVLASLCLCVVAGVGVRNWRPAAALAGVHLVEMLWLAPIPLVIPVAPVAPPAIYERLTGPGAILDLPASLPVLERARYDVWQLAHRRSIPYGLNDPTPAVFRDNRLAAVLLGLERLPVRTLPARLPVYDLEIARRLLVAQGYAWIVVHADDWPGRAAAVELLTLLCGAGLAVDGDRAFALGGEAAG